MQLLLREDVTRDEVDRAAAELRWRLLNILPRTQTSPRQIIFGAHDGEGLIAFVDDHRIAARYLAVQAHDAQSIVARAKALLPAHERRELLQLLRGDDQKTRAWALCALGVLAVADDELERAIQEAERSESSLLNDAAAFARGALP